MSTWCVQGESTRTQRTSIGLESILHTRSVHKASHAVASSVSGTALCNASAAIAVTDAKAKGMPGDSRRRLAHRYNAEYASGARTNVPASRHNKQTNQKRS